jgi:hypothetical protein
VFAGIVPYTIPSIIQESYASSTFSNCGRLNNQGYEDSGKFTLQRIKFVNQPIETDPLQIEYHSIQCSSGPQVSEPQVSGCTGKLVTDPNFDPLAELCLPGGPSPSTNEGPPKPTHLGGCNYEVPDAPSWVPQVSQEPICYQSKTCWAATAAMLLSWRDKASYDIKEAMRILGEPYVTKESQNIGLSHSETPDFFSRMGMVAVPDIYYPQDLKTALETYGPIYVIDGAPSGNYHAKMLYMIGDTSGDCSNPNLIFLDPAATFQEGTDVIPWSDFKKDFYFRPNTAMYSFPQ